MPRPERPSNIERVRVPCTYTGETGPANDLPSSACGTRILQHERYVFYMTQTSFTLHDPEARRATTPMPLPIPSCRKSDGTYISPAAGEKPATFPVQ